MSITAGVDIGGTKIQAVAIRDAVVVGSFRRPTPPSPGVELMPALVESVHDVLADAGATTSDLAGVGVGVPGTIDTAAGTVSNSPNLPGFEGSTPVPLGASLSDALGEAPVTLGNDVSVAVLGEHRRGAGRPFSNLLGVWVGTGVGGGLVIDGELFEGRGAAGEIGHTIVKPGGRVCSCGRRGHLEAYAGRGPMEARARELHAKGRRTILFRLRDKRGKPRVSSGIWLEAVERGDRIATQLLDDAVWALGVALSSIQNLLDLEAIVIGGGLGDRLGSSTLDRLREEMRPQLFVPERPPTLLGSELKDLSGAVGAAVLAGG